MLRLYVDVCIIVVLEVLKVRTNDLIVFVTDKVDLALVTQDVIYSITKVVVQVNSCKSDKERTDVSLVQWLSYILDSPSLNGFSSNVAT